MQGVSIVICCYNSSRRIPETLRYITLQRAVSEIQWEVIVIDNASTDDTTDVVNTEWQKYGLNIPFRCVYEQRAGLSHARRRGLTESAYDYIIFCDDDNWLGEDYVMRAFQLMKRHPAAGVIGGNSKPAFESTAPEWFDDFKKHFAVGPQGIVKEGIEDLTDKQRYVFGASAVFRKQALMQLHNSGHRLICSDRSGGKLLSGGDNELCYCLILLGYRIYYASTLKFQHFIPSSRLSIKYLLDLNLGAGYSQAMLLSYGPILYNLPEKKLRWYFQLAVNIVGLMRYSIIDRFVEQKALLEWKVPAFKRRGAIAAVWKERRRIASQLIFNRALAQSIIVSSQD